MSGVDYLIVNNPHHRIMASAFSANTPLCGAAERRMTTSVNAVAKPPRYRRLARRLLATVVVLGCLYVFRAPILRHVGGFLVVHQPAVAGSAILVFDGHGPLYDEAGRLYGVGDVSRVLFFRLHPRRSEQVGAVPSGDLTSRHELARRGVPEASMTVLPAEGRRAWDRAVALRDWLGDHLDENVVLLCDRFESRWIRGVLNRTLDGSDADRVHLQAVADPRYDETNWWRGKEGTIDLFNGYVHLGYVWLNGDGGEVRPDMTPDEYEQAIGASP